MKRPAPLTGPTPLYGSQVWPPTDDGGPGLGLALCCCCWSGCCWSDGGGDAATQLLLLCCCCIAERIGGASIVSCQQCMVTHRLMASVLPTVSSTTSGDCAFAVPMAAPMGIGGACKQQSCVVGRWELGDQIQQLRRRWRGCQLLAQWCCSICLHSPTHATHTPLTHAPHAPQANHTCLSRPTHATHASQQIVCIPHSAGIRNAAGAVSSQLAAAPVRSTAAQSLLMG